VRDQQCRTGKCGTNDVKFEGPKSSNVALKMQDWKMQDLENAGPGIHIHVYARVTDTSAKSAEWFDVTA